MLKLNVGLSRKVGEANYGSRGASVHLELEVESALAGDAAQLHDRIRQLFRLARTSVDEELGLGHAEPATNGHSNGHSDRRPASRFATASQVRALLAIAARQGLDLGEEVSRRFGVERVEDLSIQQASELIDAFKTPVLTNGARR